MNAVFKGLRWEKGTADIFQGYRNHYIPHNAVAGRNGTFIVTHPAKLFLTIQADDGNTITRDIADIVRGVNCWKNFSEKRFGKLRNRLESIRRFEVDEEYNVVGLEGIVLF